MRSDVIELFEVCFIQHVCFFCFVFVVDVFFFMSLHFMQEKVRPESYRLIFFISAENILAIMQNSC